MKKLITVLLIACLILPPTRAQDPPPDPQAFPLVLALIIVGLGAVSYIGVNNLVDRAFPTPYPNYVPPPPVPLPPRWKPKPSPYPRVREFKWVLGSDGYWHYCPPARGNQQNSILSTPPEGHLAAFSITNADYYDSDGQRFNTLIQMNVWSSTNNVDWQRTYCQTQWVSHANIATVVYINGSLVSSNQMALSELTSDPYGFEFDTTLWNDAQRYFKIE